MFIGAYQIGLKRLTPFHSSLYTDMNVHLSAHYVGYICFEMSRNDNVCLIVSVQYWIRRYNGMINIFCSLYCSIPYHINEGNSSLMFCGTVH